MRLVESEPSGRFQWFTLDRPQSAKKGDTIKVPNVPNPQWIEINGERIATRKLD